MIFSSGLTWTRSKKKKSGGGVLSSTCAMLAKSLWLLFSSVIN